MYMFELLRFQNLGHPHDLFGRYLKKKGGGVSKPTKTFLFQFSMDIFYAYLCKKKLVTNTPPPPVPSRPQAYAADVG